MDGGLAAVAIGTGLLRLQRLLREEQPPAELRETIDVALATLERLSKVPVHRYRPRQLPGKPRANSVRQQV